MRPLIAVLAVGGLGLAAVAIVMAGRPDTASVALEDADVPQLEVLPDAPATTDVPVAQPADLEPAAAEPDAAPPAAEPTPDAVRLGDGAPQEAPLGGALERIAPRAPLSQLATPQPPTPPKAVPPDRWKSTRLFNPVASEAGILEAQGYRVALLGIEPLQVDATCTFGGTDWPCGVQARTAFRAWLRARAISCKVPPEPDRELISAECSVGKEDPAQWLAANGWARATAGGPYAEAAKTAEQGQRGMFGPRPKRVDIAPLAVPAAPGLSEPAPSQLLVPDAPAQAPPAAPAGAFPPAPASP